MDNLIERYSRPISLISGYSTWVKAVDENWEFDETNPLNIEENIDFPKYDLYVKYPKDSSNIRSGLLNLKPNREFKVEIGNIEEIDERVYNELITYENKRWEYNKFIKQHRIR